jgi:hypothetical protein
VTLRFVKDVDLVGRAGLVLGRGFAQQHTLLVNQVAGAFGGLHHQRNQPKEGRGEQQDDDGREIHRGGPSCSIFTETTAEDSGL